MLHHAPDLTTIIDIWDALWEVSEWRPTPHGFAVALGRPLQESGGRGRGGSRVILTPKLRDHLERHRLTPIKLALPIGRTAIKRLRRLLGHHWQVDNAKWWEDRADDLTDMTLTAFVARHGVSLTAASVARSAFLVPKVRSPGWWREPDIAALLLSAQPRAHVADVLGISVGSVGRLRWRLRYLPEMT